MKATRSWRYRLYPSRPQERELNRYLYECRALWNLLLERTKKQYGEMCKFPTRKELYLQTKRTRIFSQVSQNVADRLCKSIKGMRGRKKAGLKAGFPRFKPIERMRSFTYPQFGFRLDKKLRLAGIGDISIRKHREIEGRLKTLTIKKTSSGKWFAVFTSEVEKLPENARKLSLGGEKPAVGIDLGIESFAYLSDGKIIRNPRHLKKAALKLKAAHKNLSKKKKGGRNREKAKHLLAVAYEKLANRRADFLHKLSRTLVRGHSLIALEKLKPAKMLKKFLSKPILDCAWAEFARMICYKAEEAGCKAVFVNPAGTTSECSRCGKSRKKKLAERWHSCACGASMHRDLNAAINILKRATAGTAGSNACGEEATAPFLSVSALNETGSPVL
ncbi:transposase [Candidatus Micrarchaeota archaeon]|nr:transposase [Candidatus Micrarchaeota archaeon]